MYTLIVFLVAFCSYSTPDFNDSTACTASEVVSPNHETLNNLLVGTWAVNGPAFAHADREEYVLSLINNNENYHFFGHSVSFSETGHFSANYSAPCGVDCFTSSTGTYWVEGKARVKIFVEKASQTGFCNEDTFNGSDNEVLLKQHTLGVFEIQQGENKTLILKKVE